MQLIYKGRVKRFFDKDVESFIERTGINSDSNINSDDLYSGKSLRMAVAILISSLKVKLDTVRIWDKLLCFYTMAGGTFDIIKHNLISDTLQLEEIYSNPVLGDIKPYGIRGKIYTNNLIFDFPNTLCAGLFNNKLQTDNLDGDFMDIACNNNSNNTSHNPTNIINPDLKGFSIRITPQFGYTVFGDGGAGYFSVMSRKGAVIIGNKIGPATTQFLTTDENVFGNLNLTVTSLNNIKFTFGGRTQQFATELGFNTSPHYNSCHFVGNQNLTLQERNHIANAMYIFCSNLNINPYNLIL